MDTLAKTVFITELRLQAHLALMAGQPLDTAMQAITSYPDGSIGRLGAYGAVFGHIHTLLSHAANVSKLFWPTGKKHANETGEAFEQRIPAIKRGRELRELYTIQPDNILKNRDLRNHLEHYDNRIDDTLKEVKDNGTNFIDLYIEHPNAAVPPNATFLRSFNYEKGLFLFRGTYFDLKEIARALVEVVGKSDELMAQL